MKNRLNSLVEYKLNRNFMLTTNSTAINGQSTYSFKYYIYAAGGFLNHWLQCLSLLTEEVPGNFFALTSKSNDI
jgi:hypothetical protein